MEETYDTIWRLKVKDGFQVWDFIKTENPSKNRGISPLEDYLLSRDANNPDSTFENLKPIHENPEEALRKSLDFFSTVQTEEGFWPGDYGGPMFLLPGLLIVYYILGIVLEKEIIAEMIKYLTNTQNKKDGGWGLHIEDKSTIFGTVLNYLSLRILGLGPDDDRCKRARKFILDNGGAIGIPQWGKLYLCVLNVYHYDGLDPIPPEVFYLPSWLPFHPSKWWCHTRLTSLPMAYLYGIKAQIPENDFIKELRKELFTEKFENIKWSKYRSYVNELDIYQPTSWIWKIIVFFVAIYEWIYIGFIRRWALAECYDHILYEDISTNFINIGPVNKAWNMLCIIFTEGKDSKHLKKHLERCADYFWLSKDGMKCGGQVGSQFWDTAFMFQAMMCSQKEKGYKKVLDKTFEFIDNSQTLENPKDYQKYYRHQQKGGFPFTCKGQGWIVSDCTAEGLKCVLLGIKKGYYKFKSERIYDGIDILLSLQNSTGGWATYENSRGSTYLELLNPASVFKDIMIDYDHVECSSSSIQALAMFREQFPKYRTNEVNYSIQRGIDFIKKIQKPDGSWYGNWAVCFTYGTWFAILGLLAAGEKKDSKEIQKGCEFLVKNQMKDGGWGESYLSCVNLKYTESKRSQIVNTSWALLALMAADYKENSVVDKGIESLLKRQYENGDFPQENISGVFNGNCMISYANFKNIFPIWALATYVHWKTKN